MKEDIFVPSTGLFIAYVGHADILVLALDLKVVRTFWWRTGSTNQKGTFRASFSWGGKRESVGEQISIKSEPKKVPSVLVAFSRVAKSVRERVSKFR